MELDEAEALANVLEALADLGDRLAMAEFRNQELEYRLEAEEKQTQHLRKRTNSHYLRIKALEARTDSHYRRILNLESLLLKLAGEWMEGSDDENCSAPAPE